MTRGSELWKDGYRIHRGTNARSRVFQGVCTASRLEFSKTKQTANRHAETQISEVLPGDDVGDKEIQRAT